MTVDDLITQLRQFDPTLRVVVAGFDESGFDDPVEARLIHIAQVNDGGLHCGKYESAPAKEAIGPSFDAVVIDFNDHGPARRAGGE